MDRSLDEMISERQRNPARRNQRTNERSHFGGHREPKKWSDRYTSSDFNADWVHDRYEEDTHSRQERPNKPRGRTSIHSSSESLREVPEGRLRVEDLHYDLTEEDLEDLFNRIAPIRSLTLRYDRAGRSTGTAYVTYGSIAAANRAIDEFDGAKAAGQPIHLALLASTPASESQRGRAGHNSFEPSSRHGLSLFDRIEDPSGFDRRHAENSRSRSPRPARRSNVTKPVPDGIDRYIPGDNLGERRKARTRSPSSSSRRLPRLPKRREDSRALGGKEDDRSKWAQHRVRKTQEELDAEMDDYWATKDGRMAEAKQDPRPPTEQDAALSRQPDEDIEMIT